MIEIEFDTAPTQAFNQDRYVLHEVKKIIQKFNIKNIFETGTYLGSTTKVLSGLVENLYTVESNSDYFNKSKEFLKDCQNVHMYLGNSPQIMEEVIPNLNGRTLFFLDAHWYNYCPLIDEIKTIDKCKKTDSVLIVHDFKVPGKNFGYDSYNGQDYEYSWVESHVKKLYNNNFEYCYNDIAEGANRGVLYIFPREQIQ
jgi:predicted O-methyltransferase YrrM